MHEMNQAGLTGAIGSTDATHILLDKCSNLLKNLHSGGKMKQTARSYNITVNHRRRILSTTTGHPSRWNDKTLVRFDAFVMGIKNGENLADCRFDLFERSENGIVRIVYEGVWLVVDNGYLPWSITVPPIKTTSDRREIRWSEWMESMRKDVECTFGILKGRWRILKTGIRLHGVVSADKIWMTCCALHNWLLEVDGLEKLWENGIPSTTNVWEEDLGESDDSDAQQYSQSEPLSLYRLRASTSTERQGHNTPEIGTEHDTIVVPASDDVGEDSIHVLIPNTVPVLLQDIVNAQPTPTRIVKNLSLQFFRDRLIEHFDILWEQGEITWPQR
jgi:DDE superfamily endonuclease